MLDAARVARLEADRLAKVEAKATAQLEALKKFVELKETKLRKARKIRSVRRRSDDNGGEANGESAREEVDNTTDTVVPKKMLARSKSAHMPKSGDDHRPTWLQSMGENAIGTASDDCRIEYQGVMNRTTTHTTAHFKPELGCGEKWLAAVMAERKAAAIATAQAAPNDTKEATKSQPVLSRRQSIEIAKEREKEKERAAFELIHGKGEKKGKKGPKKKQPKPDFCLLDDDELELRLTGDQTTAVIGTTRPNCYQSALSLLSNPATSSYPMATPALPGPPSNFLRHDDSSNDPQMPVIPAVTRGFRGMGSIDSPGDGEGDVPYFPHFPRAAAVPTGPPSSIYQPHQPPTSSFRMDGSPSFHQPPNVIMQLDDVAQLLQPSSIAAPPSVPPAPSSSQIIPNPASDKSHVIPASEVVFFDPVSSTADKGRLRLQDPRQFDADSIRCVPDVEKNGVTLVLGRKRCRFNPMDKIVTRVDIGSEEEYERQQEVLAVLFDRHIFTSETEASVWWRQHQHRITSSITN